MIDKIYQYLRGLGLSPSEITLYLTGLELGESGVDSLVKRSGTKRQTAYHALNGLVEKGLANENKQGRELFYTMRPASDIAGYIHTKMSNLSEQERRLEQLAPLFPQQSATSNIHSSAQTFTGTAGVERLIDVALYCRSKHWDIIAPKDNYIAKSGSTYISYFKRMRQSQSIISRSLWEEKVTSRELNLRDILSRKPRYLPKEYKGKFQSMMILFDTSIALIGSYQQPEGLLIESTEYHNLLSILFEAMWIKAEKP